MACFASMQRRTFSRKIVSSTLAAYVQVKFGDPAAKGSIFVHERL